MRGVQTTKVRIMKDTKRTRTRPNGTGTAYKRGKTWTARIVVGWKRDGSETPKPIWRTKGGFATKKEALAHCAELFTAPRSKPRLTMRDVYIQWEPTHESKVGKSTMNCYRAAWKYFAPIHYMIFSDITLDDLQECLNDCDKGKRTKENMKALAGLLMKYALPRHLTDMNYAEYLYTGDDEKGTHPAFSRDQVELIRAKVGKIPHADDVYCLIYTGFRPTEMLGLKKGDYKDGILYGGIKTEAGKDRAVPVARNLMPIIENKLVGNSDYLFPKDDGTEMSAKYFRDNYFYPVLAAAGIQDIPSPDKPAYYVPYSCRHTFANMLKSVEGADKDKAGLMGHEDYGTTKKLYQSAELDALKALINRIY